MDCPRAARSAENVRQDHVNEASAASENLAHWQTVPGYSQGPTLGLQDWPDARSAAVTGHPAPGGAKHCGISARN